LDFIGRLPTTRQGNRWILTAIDHSTNWEIAKAVPKAAEIKAVATFIYEEIVMKFACPDEIITDRGSNFLAGTLKEYLQMQEIKHLKSSAYHPRTNGKV
jgi:transposase InsO family protein